MMRPCASGEKKDCMWRNSCEEEITDANGEGIFSTFSNIQTVNISGIIKSKDPTVGVITRSPELKYLYSCSYPLEYIMNNTRLDVMNRIVDLLLFLRLESK
ncbi:unnamed protein product [Ranitomeya imitator]|uniref:Uncharacterized protein n=1 Tax=Ranitomeya imitator TaxID=111125 RepID=A0ABN9M9E6_9NEOB|nr:unnamed protein product [Ranitomeya imitator]